MATNTTNLTHHIKIINEGIDGANERFVSLEFSDQNKLKHHLLRIDNLSSRANEALEVLNRAGARLIHPGVMRELQVRIQNMPATTKAFPVATTPGFVKLPSGCQCVIPGGEVVRGQGLTPVSVSLQHVSREIAARFRVHCDDAASQKLNEYSKGNSRLIFARACAFVAPTLTIKGGDIPHFGLIGEGGTGKTVIGATASSAWGRDRNPAQGDKYGAGDTWAHTLADLENVFASYSSSFLFIDETRLLPGSNKDKATQFLNAIMLLSGRKARGRMTHPDRADWSVPVLSTSNISLGEMLEEVGIPHDIAYLDRLFEMPPPKDGFGFFEDLHGFADIGAFCGALVALNRRHFGHDSREFIRGIIADGATAESKHSTFVWFSGLVRYYMKQASKLIDAPGRNAQRLHGGFARVYAAGCLAADYGIFPFEFSEIEEAVLKCEQDHVDLVAHHLEPTSISSPAFRPPSNPIDRLRAHVRTYRDEFADTSVVCDSDPSARHDVCPGYINRKGSRTEYLFSQKTFDRVVGGSHHADTVKRRIRDRGSLETTRAGKTGERMVVKRQIGCWNGRAVRRYVTAIHASFFDQ